MVLLPFVSALGDFTKTIESGATPVDICSLWTRHQDGERGIPSPCLVVSFRRDIVLVNVAFCKFGR